MGDETMGLGEQLRAARMKRNLTTSDIASVSRMKVQIVEALEREDFSKIAAPIYAKGFIRLYAEAVGLSPISLIDEYMRRFATPQPPPSLAAASAPEQAEATDGAAPAEPAHSGRAVPADRRKTEPAVKNETAADADPDLFARVDVSARDLTRSAAREPSVARPSPLAAAIARFRNSVMSRMDLSRVRRTMAQVTETGDRLRRNVAPWGRAWFQTVRNLPEKIRFRPPDSPMTTASITAGVVIILIFIVSGFSRCVRTSDDSAVSPAEETHELRLAVDPLPPYID